MDTSGSEEVEPHNCTAAPAPPKPKLNRKTRRRAKSNRCMVIGCSIDLSLSNKLYCLRKGLCPSCLKAPAVIVDTKTQELLRFCFQCAKLEPMSAFEGSRRSCKASLQKRQYVADALAVHQNISCDDSRCAAAAAGAPAAAAHAADLQQQMDLDVPAAPGVDAASADDAMQAHWGAMLGLANGDPATNAAAAADQIMFDDWVDVQQQMPTPEQQQVDELEGWLAAMLEEAADADDVQGIDEFLGLELPATSESFNSSLAATAAPPNANHSVLASPASNPAAAAASSPCTLQLPPQGYISPGMCTNSRPTVAAAAAGVYAAPDYAVAPQQQQQHRPELWQLQQEEQQQVHMQQQAPLAAAAATAASCTIGTCGVCSSCVGRLINSLSEELILFGHVSGVERSNQNTGAAAAAPFDGRALNPGDAGDRAVQPCLGCGTNSIRSSSSDGVLTEQQLQQMLEEELLGGSAALADQQERLQQQQQALQMLLLRHHWLQQRVQQQKYALLQQHLPRPGFSRYAGTGAGGEAWGSAAAGFGDAGGVQGFGAVGDMRGVQGFAAGFNSAGAAAGGGGFVGAGPRGSVGAVVQGFARYGAFVEPLSVGLQPMCGHRW